jgi:hypothetical protein
MGRGQKMGRDNLAQTGLSVAEAAWANRKYHGHRKLLPSRTAEVKKSTPEHRDEI